MAYRKQSFESFWFSKSEIIIQFGARSAWKFPKEESSARLPVNLDLERWQHQDKTRISNEFIE